MTAGTAYDQQLLGTYPQQTKNYLSIYNPAVALACQVSGSYDRNTQTVSYDNVTEGSSYGVLINTFQVCLVGTSAGKEDVGRTWVREATPTQIRFVESDHIQWQDNLYLTILEFTEIIPVFPRIIQNPADETDVIFYKWWDKPYEGQNAQLGTVINMGMNYAGFGTRVYWSASGSYHLLDEAVTYDWNFYGSNITGSNAHTPGYVDYPGPGHHRVLFTAFGANGSADQSVRYISLYDRPGEGPNLPFLDWSRSEFTGTQDGRGYSCRIKLRDPVPDNRVRDGALVIIFSDDYYGDQQASVSNNGLGRSHIKFEGYIETGTIQYNYSDGSIEFTVISPTKMMEICEGFSISVESSASPTTWYELLHMSVKRALYHYMKWQSTILYCCDIHFDFTDRDVQYMDADRTSLYDALYTFFNGTVGGNIVSDKLGGLWFFQNLEYRNNAVNNLVTALTLDNSKWAGQPTITERQRGEICFVEIGGIQYDAETGQSTALLASAPGESPSYHGRVDKKQGFALVDQQELNLMAGNKYANGNSRYPDVQIKLRGNYCNLDIAPPEQVKLNVAVGDTPRGIVWQNKSFAIKGISWERDDRQEIERPTLTLTEVVQGATGTTLVIPVDPPTVDNPDDGNSYEQPPLTIPNIPGVVAPTTGLVNIYYNGQFVMSTDTLNFIGQIVNVKNNTTYNRADIFFDACGCSGTFSGESGTITGNIDFDAFFIPMSTTTQTFSSRTSGSYTVNVDTSGFFDNVEGTWTFTAPYTGEFNISWQELWFITSINSLGLNFNYTVDMKIGAYEATISGTQVGAFNAFTGVAQIPDGNINVYLIEGQGVTVEFTLTYSNNGGPDPVSWAMYSSAGGNMIIIPA